MKRLITIFLSLLLLTSLVLPVCAIGEGNVDSGGGSMGDGSNTNSWNPGNDGVRVTVVRANDHSVVTKPIDLTNKTPSNKIYNFGKVCKLQYTAGRGLSPVQGGYTFKNPEQPLPRIVSTSGSNNIAAIKSYFTDEQVIRSIAKTTGMDFDVLTNGDYKLLIEPFAFYTFEGVMILTTATEAAMYDQQVNGLLRKRMVSLTHKNLPLAMFLEVADLGYPAWSGNRNTAASNENIRAALGLGVVRFKEMPPEAPEVSTFDYEYRTNTEVITAVNVSGGQSDPDHPVSVTFHVGRNSYTVDNVYYPEGDSQLAWIRWTTPAKPQSMTITVNVHGSASVSNTTINVNVIDLDENPPPNPVADDRNDSFTFPTVTNKAEKTSASWSIWRPWWQENWVWISDWDYCDHGEDGGHWVDHGWWEDRGWWEFDSDQYTVSLSATMRITPDEKSPTAVGKTLKSGYGINQTVTSYVRTNQSSAVTGAQNAVTYFPEFQYETYWRLLDRINNGYSSCFEFKKNSYSTYGRRTHFTPIWFPDGSYTPHTWLIDCWTPAGMLSINLTDSVSIRGNLWSDWHIAPQNPN